MIKSLGIDIVSVGRIERDMEKFGLSFIDHILSDREKNLLEKRKDGNQFVAGRFAAKEAVIKGLGAFLEDKPPWREVEILNDPAGQPHLEVSTAVREKLEGVVCHVSISHEKENAVAVAVFEVL